jgi:hypothetical protein
MEPDTIQYHAHRVLMLEKYITMFGAAGDDLERLNYHKKRMEEIRARES